MLSERPNRFPTAVTTASPPLLPMLAPDCFRLWVGCPASRFPGPWKFPPTDIHLAAADESEGLSGFRIDEGMLGPLETQET